MTELKIKLPEDFLEAEERSGYLVTSEIKKLWAVELDLAAELLRVCKKYDIQLFTSGGTTIGAVRHGGFIPWDDDMDFQMSRSEYDRLCEVAPKEFRYPYFFQTEYTDRGSLRRHAQLRNSETTAVIEMDKDKPYKFNQGVFIDIFPLDNIVDDEALLAAQTDTVRKLFRKYMRYARWSCRYEPEKLTTIKSVLKVVRHLLFVPADRLLGIVQYYYRQYEKACAMYNDVECEYCSTYSLDRHERWYMKCSTFKGVLWMPFENLMLPVPSGYDEQLRRSYGDYMQCVREESSHGGLDFSTDIPYNEYLSRLR